MESQDFNNSQELSNSQDLNHSQTTLSLTTSTLNQLKTKIWERLSNYLPQDQEIITAVKQKVLEDSDLESIIAYLQENLAPKVFNLIKASLDSDTEIRNLIDNVRNLKENGSPIHESKNLEDQVLTLLNKHKPPLGDDENEWIKVQENLKKSFNLEQSLSAIHYFISPTKYKALVKQVAEDKELDEAIGHLKDLQKDNDPEEQLEKTLIIHFMKLLESKIADKDLLNETVTALRSSFSIDDALNILRNGVSPRDFNTLDIQKTIEKDETLNKILADIDREKKRMSSTDKALLLVTEFVMGQITLINDKISPSNTKKIKTKILESFTTLHSIQGILDDIADFISKNQLGLPADKVENIKHEALKSSQIVNLNIYLEIKEVLKSIFENCQIHDEQLLVDASFKFYETQNLEEALTPLKSKYSGSYDRLLNIAYQSDRIERIVFEKIERAPELFMKAYYIRKAKDRIQAITNHKIKFILMIDLLKHIYKNGLHTNFDLDRYQNEEDRNTLEDILKKIDKDTLRSEIDDVKVREELEKDFKEVLDLKPELLKQIIEQTLENGLMNALLAEVDNNLNRKLVNECLDKLVPKLGTKEIYKATKLLEKDFATWCAKTDPLFAELIKKVQKKEDSDTLNEIKAYLKNGNLHIDDIKEIEFVLTRIALENAYRRMETKEFIKQIFKKDYATLKAFQEAESSEEERSIKNLPKFQLKFCFQFKDLEKYITEIILQDFEAGEKLYKEQTAKYEKKNIQLAKPELLNYKKYIESNNQNLPILVELEKSKISYKKNPDQNILDDVNKNIIPRLFGLDKDLYEMWKTKNAADDFPVKDYEIPSSEYALYPAEACNQAKKISSKVKFPNIHLKTFNVVTFRCSQEDQDLMIKNWIENIDKPERFEDLLPIYFNLLKRGEDWKSFVEKVSYHIFDKSESVKLGFFKRKFLFYLLLISGDKELKARLLQLYGNYNPIPLRYPKWPIDSQLGAMRGNTLEYEFNDLIYYTIQPSQGILSLGLGNKASTPIGKSETLNKCFKTKFPTAESSPFHANTIDIDFDSSFRPYRNFCIADIHGNFPLKELQHFLALFKILIVHVHAEDLSQARAELETLCNTLKLQRQNNHLVLLIRDDNLDEGYYEENRERLKKKFPPLEPVFKLPDECSSIASLKSMVGMNSNEISVVSQKLQTTILGAVKLYKDEITVTKETFLNHLLKNLKNEDQHEIVKIDETLKSFLNEMKKYVDNFFDERAFPCRNYLSELRKVQKILRTAKTDDELRKAKTACAELEEKLKSVKSTPLIKMFADILRSDNSYLVVMELSREIKEIVSANIKGLMRERDALLNEVKPRASNNADPSNTDEAQRLKLIENQNRLKKINKDIDHRSLSIEVIWREVMALYTYNKQEVLSTLKINPIQIIKEFLDKGEPFELIDGDNLQFNKNVLEELFTTLRGKMCTISVLGPQSSGKSTLLNYLFGCQFVSSVGRCTRGIYLSILKIQNNPNYDYLMILDTEGLQSVEKNDDEFDRKITLFCLAVSQIIIVNVKGDLHLPMKSLLEICTLSLHGLNMARIDQPTIYFVFNQNPPTKDKAPFMTQISTMMKEIIDANPKAKNVARILCPSEDNLHVLGFAFQTSKEEKNINKNIWQDWPYIQPQSSFANECATLAQIIYKTLNDRFNNFSGAQNVYTEFREWSRMADDIWKTIDMFPNLLEFAAIRHMKQDRELRIDGTGLLIDRKDRLNGELVIAEKIKPVIGQESSSIMKKNPDSDHYEKIQIILNHYRMIKQEVSLELMGIRERKKYDYDLTKKHEKDIMGRIDSYEQEAILLINRDRLQCMLEVSKIKGLQGITDRINDFLLDAQVSGSKEAAGKKFEELWSKNIEQDLNAVLNPESHDAALWATISSVYGKEAVLPDLGKEAIRELHSIINQDPQKRLDEGLELSPLIDNMIQKITKGFGVQEDDKNDIFLQNILIKYRQPTNYFPLTNILKLTTNIYYLNPAVWVEWKKDVDLLFDQKIDNKEEYLKRFEDLMSAFISLGYFPLNDVMNTIRDKIQNPYLSSGFSLFSWFRSSQANIKNFFENYREYNPNIPNEKSLFERKAICFNNKQNSPEGKYWKESNILKQEVQVENADQNDNIIRKFEQANPGLYAIKNSHPSISKFTCSQNAYENGLKYCIDPFDKSVAIATAFKELREMILNETNWSGLLKDIYENIMKEINVNAESIAKEPLLQHKNSGMEDKESYYRDISSFSVDLVKNVVKKVGQKLDDYNKEILRCACKLDMAGMGKIHFYALLITWKTLCFASRKRLMEPVAKIMKEKEKWKNYFVSSVNNNLHEKSTAFAERILIEYLPRLKHKIITNHIKPKALEALEALKEEFSVASFQKFLDNKHLLSKNSDDVLQYVIKQVRFYEDRFEQLWRDYCNPLLEELKQDFKTKIIHGLDLLLQSIKKLKNFFRDVHGGDPSPVEILEIRDATGNVFNFNKSVEIEELSQNRTKGEFVQICNRAQFVLFNDYFNSHIDENWKYKEGEYSLTLKGLYGTFKALVKLNFVEEANLNKTENEISYLTIFLNSFEQILSQEMNKIKDEKLDWGYPDVGLDKLYQAYKNASVGCTESCPTCGRKCDRSGSNHTHGCDSGHQIRGMFGVMRGDYLSSKTCDGIKPDSEITIDKVTKLKWGEFTRQKFPNWDFIQAEKEKNQEDILTYRECWKNHGGAFAQHFAQLYDKMILAGYAPESEACHFLLTLDGSGSMNGKRWDNARIGVSNFLSKLKQFEDSVSKIAISIIVFNAKAQTHVKYDNLNINLDEKLIYPGGATDFNSPLHEAITLIEDEKGKQFDKHFILFYTDGGAQYPSSAMTKIINSADKAKISFFALSEEANPTVLKSMVNEFQQFGVSELKPSISPEMLVKKLPEVLNSIFHKIE